MFGNNERFYPDSLITKIPLITEKTISKIKWLSVSPTRTFCIVPLLLTLLTACNSNVIERSYEDYYQLAPENTFSPVESDPRLQGMINILSNFNPEVISTTLDDVYADPLYFHDTFHTFRSRENLKNYFLGLTENAQTTVEFLDAQSFGNDVYVRWSMTIRFSVWWKNIDVNSAGITHVRFNDDGKIVMHHDYWDGVEGFYAHLPILGSLLKSVRSGLGETGQ